MTPICIRAAAASTTTLSCAGMVYLLHDLGGEWQSEMESCTPPVVRRGPQPAAMRLHNGTADGQSHAAALGLGRIKRRKDLFNTPSRQSHSRVADREPELTVLQLRLHRKLSA